MNLNVAGDGVSENVLASRTNGKMVPPADLPRERPANQKVTKEEIRELCDLVRKRFALDADLWNLREAREHDRHKVWDRIHKADATLAKIQRTLDSWNRVDLFESRSDWDTVVDIKRRVNLPGKRNWIAKPPWCGE